MRAYTTSEGNARQGLVTLWTEPSGSGSCVNLVWRSPIFWPRDTCFFSSCCGAESQISINMAHALW